MNNIIFSLFMIIGIIYSTTKGYNVLDILISGAKSGFNIVVNLIPITCLWLGILNIFKKSGLLEKVAKLFYPVLRLIFNIPKDNVCYGYIATNILMNFLGLGVGATPIGIMAIKELDKLNENKEYISKDMIKFLIINICSVSIMPTSIISIRVNNGSKNPDNIIMEMFIISMIVLIIIFIINKILYKDKYE